MTAEEIAKANQEGIDSLKEQLKNCVSKEDYTELEKKLDGLLETNKGVDNQIKDFAETIATLKDVVSNSQRKFTDDEKYRLKNMVREKHEEIVDAIKNKKAFEIEFKVAAMHMTNNGTVTNAEGLNYPTTDNFEIDDEIAYIRYPENFILTVIPNRQVNKVPAQIIRKEQAPKEGVVTVVEEGAVKPLQQYKFVRTTTEREKWAGRIEWTEEFEMDFEALFRAILDLFEQDVVRTWQLGIFNEIISNATSYVSSTLDGTLPYPDAGLAVVAIQSQLQSLNYVPDVVVINPANLFPVMFSQNEFGDLKVTPYLNTATGTLNGMRLITSNSVEQGKVLVGESRLYREQHSQFILRTGQYNAQFIENEYTAIGEVFSILSIAEINLTGWVYADLETVMDALQEVPST